MEKNGKDKNGKDYGTSLSSVKKQKLEKKNLVNYVSNVDVIT